jgi:hypothetical protein
MGLKQLLVVILALITLTMAEKDAKKKKSKRKSKSKKVTVKAKVEAPKVKVKTEEDTGNGTIVSKLQFYKTQKKLQVESFRLDGKCRKETKDIYVQMTLKQKMKVDKANIKAK